MKHLVELTRTGSSATK